MRKEQDQKSSLKPRKFSSGAQTKALSDCQHSSRLWQSCKTKWLSVQTAARDLLEHAGPSIAGVSCRMTRVCWLWHTVMPTVWPGITRQWLPAH